MLLLLLPFTAKVRHHVNANTTDVSASAIAAAATVVLLLLLPLLMLFWFVLAKTSVSVATSVAVFFAAAVLAATDPLLHVETPWRCSSLRLTARRFKAHCCTQLPAPGFSN